MLTASTTFFKGRESAAGSRFSIVPGSFYAFTGRKLPKTIALFESAGVLERLDGPPGRGFDVEAIADEWFTDDPAPKPDETPIDKRELLARLRWTREQFDTARALYGFPKPNAQRGGPSAEQPDAVSQPLWLWSAVNAWLTGLPRWEV